MDASPQVQLVNWQHNVSKSKYFVLKKSILKIPFQYLDFTREEERNIREMIFYCFFQGREVRQDLSRGLVLSGDSLAIQVDTSLSSASS